MDRAEHDWIIGAGSAGRTGGNSGMSHQQQTAYPHHQCQYPPQPHPSSPTRSQFQPHHLHPSSPTSRNNYQNQDQSSSSSSSAPRQESGIYDSFLTGYIDLYKKPKPDLETVEDD